MGKATLVVMAAEDVVPDPEVLCDHCVASLQEMVKAAWLLARGELDLDYQPEVATRKLRDQIFNDRPHPVDFPAFFNDQPPSWKILPKND